MADDAVLGLRHFRMNSQTMQFTASYIRECWRAGSLLSALLSSPLRTVLQIPLCVSMAKMHACGTLPAMRA